MNDVFISKPDQYFLIQNNKIEDFKKTFILTFFKYFFIRMKNRRKLAVLFLFIINL